MTRSQQQWIEEYKNKDALWIHDGNPKRPHALLTSGKHSNGFFNSRLVIPDDVLMRDAASDLIEIFEYEGGHIDDVEGVVGPQTGATKLAELISTQIVAYTRGDCFSASPAKSEKDGEKSMLFSDEELTLLHSQWILLCEDVLTTGGSVDLTVTAVKKAEGIILPFILVLVNRSGLTEVSGKKIVALIDHPMPMWTTGDCLLCKKGSQAIRPKGKDEWARLNAVY